ncbi:Serine/threonine-protein kinase receptor R3 [Sarcoptes scabiei]|nr:Serine/threonine-protein kinase receptor R3 [Sarcoptes scabiei]
MATQCRCRYADCLDGSTFGSCRLLPGGYCFTFFEEIHNEVESKRNLEKRFGCFGPGDEALFQCKGYLSDHEVYKNISCCNSYDFCNDDLLKEINDGEIVFEERFNLINPFFVAIIFSLCAIVFIAFTLLCLYQKLIAKNQIQVKKSLEDSNSQKLLLPGFACPANRFEQSYEDDNNNHQSPYHKSLNNMLFAMNNATFQGRIGGIGSSSNDSSGSGSSSIPIKYSSFNNGSHNGSFTTIDSSSVLQSPSYYFSASMASNTTSSLMSENTQQTVLSSQKTTLPPVNEDSITSGSGSGVPRLIQKTIAREINLIECIGKGRFGRVWLGVRHCEKYAVKIFFSRDEASWMNEVGIHQGIIMRHENIVTFFSADIVSCNGCTQLWLVTEFHELGSLYDYLNRTPIKTIEQMLSLMKSIIFGLSHLHIEVNGTQGKPIIVHRDLKSQNILMKSENCCCISDFASAIIESQFQSDSNRSILIGTNRYKAPEILNSSIGLAEFKNHLPTDIYSIGLVFWEILNRTIIEGQINDYQRPFEEYVQKDDPSITEMKEIVCERKIRPCLEYYYENQILASVSKLIKECWLENPNARLSSLRIKKTIIDIYNSLH